MKFNSLILLVVSAFFMFACDSATKFNNPLDEHNKPSDQTDTEAETDNDGDKTDTMSENDDDKTDTVSTNDDDGECTEGTFKCHSMFVSHICKNGEWQFYKECPVNEVCNEKTGECEKEDLITDNDSSDTTPDNDSDSSDTSSPDNDMTTANPCNPNPCSSVANSNGNCTASGSTNYSCGCKTHYTWNSSSKTCVADSQTVNCTGLPTTGAVWNTVSSITQTWNGSDWEPSNVATHNNEASTQECRYRCKEHYTWTNSTCKADQQVKNCTEIPANAEWNTVSTITQTWNGSAWTPSTDTTYNETGSTSECRFKCAENYTYENSQCIGAKRTKTCDGLPKNALWNTAESIEQTWDGYDWIPSNIGVYNTTASTDYCRYKCDEYCEWKDSKCVSPCDYDPCVSVENSTGHCTVTGWNEYSCECELGYFYKNSECKKVTHGNICTGQNKCYGGSSEQITCSAKNTDFFGQDAQYAGQGTCIPKSFTTNTISDDNIRLDLNTGLMWQAKSNKQTSWNNAVSYCNNLIYAGYDDWRLPTPKELLTNSDALSISNHHWSSAAFVNDTEKIWSVEGYTVTLDSLGKAFFICVRGTSKSTDSLISSTIDGDEIVTDTDTDLIWQKTYVSDKNWKEALSYCENLTYAGYSDWRLPNINELASLLNYEKYDPASDFPDIPSIWVKSSTTALVYKDKYSAVNFQNGVVGTGSKVTLTSDYVLCVRSGSEKPLPTCDDNPCKNIPDSTLICFTGISGDVCNCSYGDDKWTSQCMHMLPECSKTSATPCYDSKAVLVWSKKSESTMTYSQARSYCSDYSEGGFSDWRVPNIDELMTLLMASRVTQKCEVSSYNGHLSLSKYWTCESCSQTGSKSLEDVTSSATDCFNWGDSYSDGRYSKFGDPDPIWSISYVDGSNGVWYIDFRYGYVHQKNLSYTSPATGEGYKLFVRCVRN